MKCIWSLEHNKALSWSNLRFWMRANIQRDYSRVAFLNSMSRSGLV